MAENRKFLICYDIVDDKRLRRVHQLLSNHAMAVQYSIFEAELSNSELDSLKEKILSCINTKQDKVTIYRLFKTNAKTQLAKTAPDDFIYI